MIVDDWKRFSSAARFSMIAKTLSTPMDIPTQGVWTPEVLNIPTKLSYLPPRSNEPESMKLKNEHTCRDGADLRGSIDENNLVDNAGVVI